MTAVYYENKKMVEMLIDANSNLELLDSGSNTVMQIALDICNKEIIELILSEMGKISKIIEIQFQRPRFVFDYLKLIEKKQIEERQKLEKNLQDAVFDNDLEETRTCLSAIDPAHVRQVINSTTSGNHTLLFRACRNGNAQIVKLFLDHGAIARPHFYTKYSPLYIACHMGNMQIAQMILYVIIYQPLLGKSAVYSGIGQEAPLRKSKTIFWILSLS
jgi:ankyrin repeat protein